MCTGALGKSKNFGGLYTSVIVREYNSVSLISKALLRYRYTSLG